MSSIEELKKEAAIAALDAISDGMTVGLGTGSTATYFIRELGNRVKQGLKVRGIPTSEVSHRLAQELNIPLTTLREHPVIDVTVDGADEVSKDLELIKGLGGALVREKIVAHASRFVIIVVDESKLSESLGSKAPVPVEVVPFALDFVLDQLKRSSGETKLRMKDGKNFVSDNGNLIVDWWHGRIDDPEDLERQIKAVTGVVDSGIFAGVADLVLAATSTGVQRLERKL